MPTFTLTHMNPGTLADHVSALVYSFNEKLPDHKIGLSRSSDGNVAITTDMATAGKLFEATPTLLVTRMTP